MKKLRVTYNYHSMLHDTYTHMEISLAARDFEAEDVLQEFDACSHHLPIRQNDSNFPMLKLLALICTAQVFLAGDVVEKTERENIRCITDVEETGE